MKRELQNRPDPIVRVGEYDPKQLPVDRNVTFVSPCSAQNSMMLHHKTGSQESSCQK